LEQDEELGKKLREMLNSFSPMLASWSKTSEIYRMLESFRELWVGNRQEHGGWCQPPTYHIETKRYKGG